MVTAAAIVAFGFWAFRQSPRPRCITVGGRNQLAIRLNTLLPGTARFFCYQDNAGRKLRFILARSRDGKVLAAFDACRHCYNAHEGYTVKNGELVCRRCGNAYKIGHLTKGKASCVPVHLRMKQHGGEALIKVSDLEAKRGLF